MTSIGPIIYCQCCDQPHLRADIDDDIEFSCTHCGHLQDLPEHGVENP